MLEVVISVLGCHPGGEFGATHLGGKGFQVGLGCVRQVGRVASASYGLPPRRMGCLREVRMGRVRSGWLAAVAQRAIASDG